jgi:hypothetical protein
MPDRIQREVEDLLARLDTFPRKRPIWARAWSGLGNGLRGLGSGLKLPNLSAGHILLIAIGIIVLAWVLLPGGSDLARWFIAGGIVLFIGAFIFSLRRQSRPPEKYWRDKPLDLHGGSRSWWDRWRNRR